jgi:CHAT domain-containing protein
MNRFLSIYFCLSICLNPVISLGVVQQSSVESKPLFLNTGHQNLTLLTQNSVDIKAQGDSLLDSCKTQIKKGLFQAAIELCQKSAAVYKNIDDKSGQAKSLMNIAFAYRFLNNYPKARDYYQQVSQLLGLTKVTEIASTFVSQRSNFLSQVLQRKAERLSQQNNNICLSKAEEFTKYTVQILKKEPFNADQAWVEYIESFFSITIIATNMVEQKFSDSIEYAHSYLLIARKTNNKYLEAQALSVLGQIYGVTGDFQSISYLQQAQKINQAIRNCSSEKENLSSLATAYLSLDEYAKAEENQEQVLNLTRKTRDHSQEALELSFLTNIYIFQKKYTKALEVIQEAIQKSQLSDDMKVGSQQTDIEFVKSLLRANLFGVYLALENYDKALEIAQQDLKLALQKGDNFKQVALLWQLAIVNEAIEDKAQGNYVKTLDLYNQIFAKVQEEKKDGIFNVVFKFLEPTLRLYAGRTFLKAGNLTEAEKNLFTVIQLQETLRRGLEDSSKVSIFDKQINAYRTLQQILIAQNKLEKGLEIAERARARSFLDLIARSINPKLTNQFTFPLPDINQIKKTAKVTNSTLVQYSIILDDLKLRERIKPRELELYIWVVKPTGEVSFRQVDLKPLWQKQNISLREKITQARKSIVTGVNISSRGNNITFTPGDRVKLKDDLPQWDSWEVLSVNPQKQTITVWLPSGGTGTKGERPITEVVEKVTSASSANAKNPQLQEFYQLLIQPIANLLPKEEAGRVIFIPQDALFLVPFPALQDPSGKYLIDKHTILTAPSIEVLDSTHKLRQKVPGSAKDILVVGNPTMPKVSKMPGEPPQQLSALPGSEKEALAIASLWKTQALLGNQATKKVVLKKLHDAKIIHLGTHGLLDDIRGLGSSIVFAPEGEDNGLLTAEDILNLYTPPQGSALSAELVVLSACDTGQGRLTGDGVIGLSRSIIAAGVPSVIVSLWSIPDAPTAELMTEFYQNFRKNPDKATALREAMLTTKKKHPNPADWAAFTLIGESE